MSTCAFTFDKVKKKKEKKKLKFQTFKSLILLTSVAQTDAEMQASEKTQRQSTKKQWFLNRSHE